MEKKAHQAFKTERLTIANPPSYLPTDCYSSVDNVCKPMPHSTKHSNTGFVFNAKYPYSPKENKTKIKEGLKHMLSSELFKAPALSTAKIAYKTKVSTITNSPKKYTTESNYIKERAFDPDKFSKLSSTKNSSNISKKESQNGSSYWTTDMLQSKDSLPLSTYTEKESIDINEIESKRHPKGQISMGSAQFHYSLNGNTFLSKIQETMKAGNKIKLNSKRQPAVSMSHIRLPHEEETKIACNLSELKTKMQNFIISSKRKEQKLHSIIDTLTLQLNDALRQLKRYEESA